MMRGLLTTFLSQMRDGKNGINAIDIDGPLKPRPANVDFLLFITGLGLQGSPIQQDLGQRYVLSRALKKWDSGNYQVRLERAKAWEV